MLKKLSRKIICLCAAVCAVLCSAAVSAENYQGVITVSTEKAATGSSVIVKLDMSENPGIMAMTISITYDSKALSYERFYTGYLNDIMIEDHPDKNLLRLVSCEKMNRRNNDTIVSLQFKVKDDAAFNKHSVSVDYKPGDFCNWKLERLNPKIVPGGVDVEFNGKNCRHTEKSEWETAAKPTCKGPGAKQRHCLKCGTVEIEEIPSAGHVFSEEWVVDRPATAELHGIMSRHCNNCDEVTDVLTFELDQVDDLEIDNTQNSFVSPSEKTDKLMKEQKPESKENNGSSKNPESSDKSDSNRSETDSSSNISQSVISIGKKTDIKQLFIIIACVAAVTAVTLIIVFTVKRNKRT